jgi:hypothetical protein
MEVLRHHLFPSTGDAKVAKELLGRRQQNNPCFSTPAAVETKRCVINNTMCVLQRIAGVETALHSKPNAW